VDTTSPAAPIAGLRGARTGVVGLWPTGASMALVDPRSGREADLPGPTGRPAGHQVSPPLAWLPGSDQPAKQAGTAQPEPHCRSTVRPGGEACRARSGCGRRPEGVTAGASSPTIFPASPTTSNPSSCSRARANARKGVVVDDQHGLGHRLIVARAEAPRIGATPGFRSPPASTPPCCADVAAGRPDRSRNCAGYGGEVHRHWVCRRASELRTVKRSLTAVPVHASLQSAAVGERAVLEQPKALVEGVEVGAGGVEPPSSSVSANHRGTAVRRAVSPGHARPSGPKLSGHLAFS
jgi:hypothetical protein